MGALSPKTERRSDPRHLPGTPGYRRVNLGMFAVSVATYALLYATQALLPTISDDLGGTPSQASLTVSGCTGALALAVIPVSALSEKFGRTRVMTACISVAVLVSLMLPLAPDLNTLIALRVVQGAALAGMPATAMAYLSEEIHPSATASAMALFVAGNSLGGMSSRVITGLVAQVSSWRIALATVGVLSLACAATFRLVLPKATQFHSAPINPMALLRTVTGHLGNPLLRRLYAIGMMFMAVFGSVFTVIGYRLTDDPFNLPQGVVGLVFVVYVVGTGSSSAAAWLTGRIGRRGAIYLAVAVTAAGLVVSLADSLVAVALGLMLVTAGFFAGHAVASSSVSRSVTAGRAQASALYLMAYYIGNSVGGYTGATAYHSVGWTGAAAVGLIALACASAVTARGTRRAILSRRREPATAHS